MKKIIALITISCFILTISGCATSPENINTAYVSALQYNSYSCSQLGQEYARIEAKVSDLTKKQRKDSTKDAVAMGVGLILFWPALFFLIGSKGNPEELGRLKGECEAIERASIEKDCIALAARIVQDRETAKKEMDANDELIKQREKEKALTGG